MASSPLTRPSLLLQIRDAKNEEAWEAFVSIYTPLVFGFYRNQGLQEADALDITQDVMRAVSQSIRRFDYDSKKGKFRGWLFTIARNKLKNWLISNQRHPDRPYNNAAPITLSDQPSASETDLWEVDYQRQLFRWALEQVRSEFNDATWQAFHQTAVEQIPGKTVAQSLKLSVGAVYVAKSRVLARIRECIHGIDDEEPWAADHLG